MGHLEILTEENLGKKYHAIANKLWVGTFIITTIGETLVFKECSCDYVLDEGLEYLKFFEVV